MIISVGCDLAWAFGLAELFAETDETAFAFVRVVGGGDGQTEGGVRVQGDGDGGDGQGGGVAQRAVRGVHAAAP